MLTIDVYHWFMKRYVDLVNEHYKEPGIEMFDDVTTSVIRALEFDESESYVEATLQSDHWRGDVLKITSSIYRCIAMNFNNAKLN